MKTFRSNNHHKIDMIKQYFTYGHKNNSNDAFYSSNELNN